MKYCSKCGAQLEDDAFYCSRCGSLCNKRFSPESERSVKGSFRRRDRDLMTIAYILCIVCTVLTGFLIFPLFWTIPLTVSLYHKVRDDRPISIAFKVIIMLFVSFIGGIFLLIGDDSDEF